MKKCPKPVVGRICCKIGKTTTDLSPLIEVAKHFRAPTPATCNGRHLAVAVVV